MEVELGVFGDFSPYIIWTNYFLNGKYYGVNNTNLYHDKSVILLENTSCVSSSNHTKHISLISLFIEDRIQYGEVTI